MNKVSLLKTNSVPSKSVASFANKFCTIENLSRNKNKERLVFKFPWFEPIYLW